MCDIIQEISLIITEQPIFSSFLSNIWKELSFWFDLIITVVKFLAKLVELNQLHLTRILTSFSPQPTFSDRLSLGICNKLCFIIAFYDAESDSSQPSVAQNLPETVLNHFSTISKAVHFNSTAFSCHLSLKSIYIERSHNESA